MPTHTSFSTEIENKQKKCEIFCLKVAAFFLQVSYYVASGFDEFHNSYESNLLRHWNEKPFNVLVRFPGNEVNVLRFWSKMPTCLCIVEFDFLRMLFIVHGSCKKFCKLFNIHGNPLSLLDFTVSNLKINK